MKAVHSKSGYVVSIQAMLFVAWCGVDTKKIEVRVYFICWPFQLNCTSFQLLFVVYSHLCVKLTSNLPGFFCLGFGAGCSG